MYEEGGSLSAECRTQNEGINFAKQNLIEKEDFYEC